MRNKFIGHIGVRGAFAESLERAMEDRISEDEYTKYHAYEGVLEYAEEMLKQANDLSGFIKIIQTALPCPLNKTVDLYEDMDLDDETRRLFDIPIPEKITGPEDDILIGFETRQRIAYQMIISTPEQRRLLIKNTSAKNIGNCTLPCKESAEKVRFEIDSYCNDPKTWMVELPLFNVKAVLQDVDRLFRV